MKGKKKPDNLEQFFQRVLRDYEEDPGVAFWDRIAPQIPPKPPVVPVSTIAYKGWMVVSSFLAGLLMSAVVFYWLSNTKLINNLETELIENKLIVKKMEQEIIDLKQSNQTLTIFKETILRDQVNSKKEILQSINRQNKDTYNPFQKTKKGAKIEKSSLIKPEIARKTGAVAATFNLKGSELPPFAISKVQEYANYFEGSINKVRSYQIDNLRFDPVLISNNISNEYKKEDSTNPQRTIIANELDHFNLLTRPLSSKIDFDFNSFKLSEKEKKKLLAYNSPIYTVDTEEDWITSYITASINPVSSFKYNLKGYVPQAAVIQETEGISSSWNWSIYGGFETKTKWSVQMGLDFNKLTIVKESVNNVRFNLEDAKAINGGYLYSFNQRSDGALRQVSISSTIFNQQKNDGQDVQDGDLFKIAFSTQQPIKIIRLPILGGYRFDLSKRFYVTPKIGVSAVWKTKEQTQLRASNTFSERLSIQNSNIFLTSTTTTESLEANMRAEFGFRWRPRWYLVAEPRFKYSGNALFSYKQLALRDAPFHLMVGIRFNVD